MAVPVHERMLEVLEAEGIDTLFGIPDPSFVGMFIAAETRGWRVVAPHHEQAGAFMADGLWRMTGRPGVIVGNQGPGVANLVAGAICAAKENVPTLFIAGQRQREFDQRVRRGRFQYTRQPRYFEEAMKYVGIIEYPEQTDEILHEAFRRALSGTPGPVYVEFPMQLLRAELTLAPAARPATYRLVEQAASAPAIAAAQALIEQASAPILLLGQGAFVSRAHAAVTALARALRCPIIQTPGAAAYTPAHLDELCKAHAAHRRQLFAAVPQRSRPVHPARFVVEATRVLPDDAVMVRDGGAVNIFTWAYSQLAARDVIWSQNFGHLGTGLPHAIGAQLAVGSARRVVLMTGDSSFLFHISELETAVRKHLPVVCIVGCDFAWGLEVAVYKGNFGLQSPETEAHWGKQVRLDRIAEGFGAHGEYVERAEDIAAAVERALASGKPAVVQVPIDDVANATEVPGFEEFASWYGDAGY
jgi:thiamine pyrophosphate-dependent acetolactate synthase large subunit-like protein